MISQQSVSLARFWTPPYWASWLIYLWMRTTVKLPYATQLALGKRVGRLMYILFPGRRLVAERNLALCFAWLSSAERRTLTRRHFEAVGAATAEMSMAWYGSEQTIRDLVSVEGEKHLLDALAKGKGVILFSGHFTTFEFFFAVLKRFCPSLCGMYKPQRNALTDEIMRRGRSRNVDELFPKTSVRTMLKHLRRNAVVWYASDQNFRRKQCELIPFFNEPAMTNTAISRLAKASGATVLPYFCRRLDDDSGYVMTIGAPLQRFPSDDPVEDTRRLTALLEEYIELCPEQYLWIHRRFKGRPAPFPDVYRTQEQRA